MSGDYQRAGYAPPSGDLRPGEPMIQFRVSGFMPAELMAKLQASAAAEQVTQATIVRRALSELLDRERRR